ncbi:MAG: hypothetical protein KIS68_01150 [Bauldia sp.]|nr:hypothetical protein [Bauldia sp.]
MATISIVFAAQQAAAEDCAVWSEGPTFPAKELVAYATGISPEDIVDAAGNALAEVTAVLRRDRENFHFGAGPGRGDEPDSLFGDAANLRLFDGASVIFYCDWPTDSRESLAADILGARLESRTHVTVYLRPDGTVALLIEAWG